MYHRLAPVAQSNPLLPGYPFNAWLVAGLTPIGAGDPLDFFIDRPSGMKGYIINLTIKGRGQVFSGEEAFECEPGDLLLFQPKTSHYYGRSPESDCWHHRWIYFRPRAYWSSWLVWQDEKRGVGRLRLPERLWGEFERLFTTIEQTHTSGKRFAEELAMMKPGSLLINASRGTVVDIPALCKVLADKHLAGAAIDVFPEEPATNAAPFNSPLCEFDNVILTPHIGGSTQEAQENIGIEVAGKLAKYSDNGSTLSAVNFPEVSLPMHGQQSRLLHIHENRPGVLTAINNIFAGQGINIAAQYLQTTPMMGYVVIDIDATKEVADNALQQMKAIPGTIRARLLY